MSDKNFYITTPIYYVNGVPHMGSAYTTLACDVMARFKRLDGYDVHFLTGTDEHGQKVYKAAQDKGVDPQTFTDAISQNFRDLCDLMNYTQDDFIRTTEERHKIAAQALWKRLEENGHIYLDKYAGWYAVRDEAFYNEDELETNEAGEKVGPTGAPVEWMEEESFFFDLSKWQEPLLKYYEDHPEFIMPKSRRNEVISFVKGGLKDLSISRTSFDWGVPVPGHEDKHVMYVWIDALTNYMTSLGYPDTQGEKFQKFWPEAIHVLGKDILRFHAVYWPAFLLAADLPLPKQIYAHGWWTVEGHKMSKSLGNTIMPKHLVDTYGLDASRYFLLREVPFGNDGDFSHDAMVGRMNSDLANGIGNLAQRTLSMIFKNCDKIIPEPNDFNADDEALLEKLYALPNKVREQMDGLNFNRALEAIWIEGIANANQYVDEQAPWTLKKTDPERMKTVLYVLAENVRVITILLQAFMPDSCAKILDQLGVIKAQRHIGWAVRDKRLKSGVEIPKPEGAFPRYVEEEKAEQSKAG